MNNTKLLSNGTTENVVQMCLLFINKDLSILSKIILFVRDLINFKQKIIYINPLLRNGTLKYQRQILLNKIKV